MADCIHEMPLDWCGICKPVELGLALASGPSIRASQDGHCAHCDDEIEEGDSITYSNEAGGWCLTRHTEQTRMTREPDDIDLSAT